MIPTVEKKIVWCGIRSVDISYAKILLNSTNINNNMHQKRLAESPNCECERNRETLEHFLLECKLYEEQRVKIVKAISEMWFDKEI